MQPLKTLQNLTDFCLKTDKETIGLITNTEERLRSLERETYHIVRSGSDASQELQMLDFLLKSQKHQNELKEKSEDRLSDTIHFFWHLILIGITCFSIGKFVVAPTKTHCLDNDSQSQYCQVVKDKVEYFTGK